MTSLGYETVDRGQFTSSPDVLAALKPFVESGVLAGAVALVTGADEVDSLDTIGLADIKTRRPMLPDTVFWIASQTKPITAAAFMMLVDEGKVRVDDPVERFIPEFKDLWLTAEADEWHILLKKPSRAVTMLDLLTHTSGMPFRTKVEFPTLDFLPLREGVLSYVMAPLLFEPGTAYCYSNTAINTIGRVIELVSDTPYETFMQTRLFNSLGMVDTTFWPNAEQLTRLAKNYQPVAEGQEIEEAQIQFLQYPLDNPQRKPMPAGGLFSTAPDIAKFCQMFLQKGQFGGNRYLSEAAVYEMTRVQSPGVIQEKVGLAWYIDGTSYSHGGACSTNMSVHPDQNRALVYMVQHSGFPGNGADAGGAFRKAALEAG